MRLTVRLCALVATILGCFSAGQLVSAQAPPPVSAGQVIISELRYRGPDGARDEFIELYNNTDANILVQASDQTGGWSIVTSNGQITGAICLIPNGTVIPARGHFLCVNNDPDFQSGYSLTDYPSGNPTPTATPTPTPTGFARTTQDRNFIIDDLPDGFGVALFKTQNGTQLVSANRLDAFGFINSPALFKEGNGFPTIPAVNNEHTLFRDLRSSLPKDTNDNAADFLFVATTSSLQTSLLGAPGPENLLSPVVKNSTISAVLLDPNVAQGSPENRVRNFTPETNAPLGTMLIRRRFTNNTGAPVSRLRFRVVNITTRGTPPAECANNCADVRALTSPDTTVIINATPMTVRGVTLEENPPLTPEGGGYNSSLSANFISLATPLAAGASVNIQFKLGVVKGGNFRYYLNIEAQNAPAPPPIP